MRWFPDTCECVFRTDSQHAIDDPAAENLRAESLCARHQKLADFKTSFSTAVADCQRKNKVMAAIDVAALDCDVAWSFDSTGELKVSVLRGDTALVAAAVQKADSNTLVETAVVLSAV